MSSEIERVLADVDGWGADHAAAGVLTAHGRVVHGDLGRQFHWASVTKPVTALAVLLAVDRGLLRLDDPAGPPGSTVRHLLAHTSGLPFDGDTAIGSPGRRRVYSNTGYDLLGDIVSERAGEPFGAVLSDWILAPIGAETARLEGRPSEGINGALADALAVAAELSHSTLLTAESRFLLSNVAFPGLRGVVPGVGSFDPCDWGLGVEIHGAKRPHWMGTTSSAETFGHLGVSGTFVWVDPAAKVALVALTDRPFGPWAMETWPGFSDDILSAASEGSHSRSNG